MDNHCKKKKKSYVCLFWPHILLIRFEIFGIHVSTAMLALAFECLVIIIGLIFLGLGLRVSLVNGGFVLGPDLRSVLHSSGLVEGSRTMGVGPKPWTSSSKSWLD